MSANTSSKAAFSIPSIIAVVAAIASFQVGAILGLILAGVAVLFGVIGVALALSPGTRGGIFSVMGVIGGLAGVIAAIVKAIMWFT